MSLSSTLVQGHKLPGLSEPFYGSNYIRLSQLDGSKHSIPFHNYIIMSLAFIYMVNKKLLFYNLPVSAVDKGGQYSIPLTAIFLIVN